MEVVEPEQLVFDLYFKKQIYKMKTNHILLGLLLLCCIQHIRSEEIISTVNVNGLHIWGKYSKQQVDSILGVPISYRDTIVKEAMEPIGTRFQTFNYQGGDTFSLTDGDFTDFELKTSRFKINNTIAVGDSTSHLSNLASNCGLIYSESVSSLVIGEYKLYSLPIGESYIRFVYDNDFIKEIYFETYSW
ncbi:MAG: hypothetical protein PHS30_02775 [Bacteroidales bacterium]|nr:hypothetical protein [Bacteroidales bacterium]